MEVHNNKSEGSILLELVIGLSIGMIILNGFIFIMNTALKSYESTDEEDNQFFESDYLLTYLENEINKADRIYLSNKNYPIVFYRERANSKERHLYYTYIIKDEKVVRLAEKYKSERRVENLLLTGENKLCENINDFQMELKNDLIDIKVNLGKDRKIKDYHKKIFFKCEIID